MIGIIFVYAVWQVRCFYNASNVSRQSNNTPLYCVDALNPSVLLYSFDRWVRVRVMFGLDRQGDAS